MKWKLAPSVTTPNEEARARIMQIHSRKMNVR